jgi:crotonobetainyl-CoA:carnitine CoA-transferase CaiB-like acyl-CoA transferase
MNLAIGVLAALYKAQATGQGERVEVSLVDSVLALTTQDYIDYGHTKSLPKQLGNGYSLWCPYGSYKAKDRYYSIGIGTEAHWEVFCTQVLHKPELVSDPRFCSHAARVENRAATDKLVDDWAQQLPAVEVVDLLNKANIPSALVYDFADIEADENFTVHRQMIKHMEHPQIGDIAYINMPVRFCESGLKEPEAAGALGQFNEEVYGECLGLSPEEVEQLRKDGVI